MTEQQIKEEILRYLKDDAYNYAVLIDGEWGSGKTYFVKNVLSKAIYDQEKDTETPRTVRYVSLYGCKNIADVQENIAWASAKELAEGRNRKSKGREEEGETISKITLSSVKIGSYLIKNILPGKELTTII